MASDVDGPWGGRVWDGIVGGLEVSRDDVPRGGGGLLADSSNRRRGVEEYALVEWRWLAAQHGLDASVCARGGPSAAGPLERHPL